MVPGVHPGETNLARKNLAALTCTLGVDRPVTTAASPKTLTITSSFSIDRIVNEPAFSNSISFALVVTEPSAFTLIQLSAKRRSFAGKSFFKVASRPSLSSRSTSCSVLPSPDFSFA